MLFIERKINLKWKIVFHFYGSNNLQGHIRAALYLSSFVKIDLCKIKSHSFIVEEIKNLFEILLKAARRNCYINGHKFFYEPGEYFMVCS